MSVSGVSKITITLGDFLKKNLSRFFLYRQPLTVSGTLTRGVTVKTGHRRLQINHTRWRKKDANLDFFRSRKRHLSVLFSCGKSWTGKLTKTFTHNRIIKNEIDLEWCSALQLRFFFTFKLLTIEPNDSILDKCTLGVNQCTIVSINNWNWKIKDQDLFNRKK